MTQGEAIDALVDHCAVVTTAWSELQGKADETALQRLYGQAKRHLATLFTEAQEAGVDKDCLIGILIDRIPTSALQDLATSPRPRP